MTQRKAMLLAATAALFITACSQPGDKAANGAATAENTVAPGNAETATRSKLSAYTIGYNKLLDTFGLPPTAERYMKEEISTKKPTDSISVTDGWLEQAQTLLTTARALPGGPADVDQSADTLIGALATVRKRLDGLKVYYDSKAYKDDGLKRGKAEDAAMIAEFKTALAAMEQFSTMLDRERKIASVAELSALKAKGDMLGYNTKYALQQAERLISMFKGGDDIKDAAVIARADAQLAVLEKALADQRAELVKAKAAATPAKSVDVNYGLVADRLTSVVGDYREMKQSRDPDDFNDMIGHYNDAIGDANDIRS